MQKTLSLFPYNSLSTDRNRAISELLELLTLQGCERKRQIPG